MKLAYVSVMENWSKWKSGILENGNGNGVERTLSDDQLPLQAPVDNETAKWKEVHSLEIGKTDCARFWNPTSIFSPYIHPF